MRQTWVFAALAAGLVALAVLATRPLLGAGSWTWLALAAGVALTVQLALRLVLTGWRRDPKRFMRAIAAGAIGRLLVVAAALIWVAVRPHPHPVAFLISLAGFLFVLLMLEALLENSSRFREPEPARAHDVDAATGKDADRPAQSLARG